MKITLTGGRYKVGGRTITRIVGEPQEGDDGPWKLYAGRKLVGKVTPAGSPAIKQEIEAHMAKQRKEIEAREWGSNAWFGDR